MVKSFDSQVRLVAANRGQCPNREPHSTSYHYLSDGLSLELADPKGSIIVMIEKIYCLAWNCSEGVNLCVSVESAICMFVPILIRVELCVLAEGYYSTLLF